MAPAQRHSCDLCGLDLGAPVRYDPRVAVCGNCGFVYVPERRGLEEIARAWDDVYDQGLYDPSWPGVKARLFYVAEWLNQHYGLDGKSVLDIGAGDGYFLGECGYRGAKTTGIEPYAANVEKCRHRGIECFHQWIDEKSNHTAEYDFVTLNWTLENTADLHVVLDFARSYVKPDGYVVVSTGARILSGFRKPISLYFNRNIPADLHCFHFSGPSLRNALASCGLATVRTNDYGQNDVMVHVAAEGEATTEVLDPALVQQFFKDWERYWPS